MAEKNGIVVNGVEYASVEAMPQEARSQYESVTSLLADRDGNGIPDLVERPAGLAEALDRLPRGSFSGSTATQHSDVQRDGERGAPGDAHRVVARDERYDEARD